MDVARDGHPSADKLLIVSSACHGVEGFCGSGVQVAALHDARVARARARRGVAVLYVHALNPYGFSHIRRTTHENVDLNRNFHDFTQAAAGQPGLPRAAPAAAARRNGRPRRPTQPAIGNYLAHAWRGGLPGGHHPRPVRVSRRPVLRRRRRPPGATWPCARCCARTAGAPRALPGSTSTPGWARAAWASASSPAATTRQHRPRPRLVGRRRRDAGDLDLRRLLDLGLPHRA